MLRHFAKSVFWWTLLYALPLFLAAGDPTWPEAWIYVGVNWISMGYLNFVVYRRNPELSQIRAQARDQAADWDRRLVPWIVFFIPVSVTLVAGFDHRLRWTNIAPAVSIIAFGGYLLGITLINASMAWNASFSSYVHIRAGAPQPIADRGPYAWVRHPGYLGMIWGQISLPLFLGSLAALPLGIIGGLLLLRRTFLEDRFLTRELQGYLNYTQSVRWRIFPGIW